MIFFSFVSRVMVKDHDMFSVSNRRVGENDVREDVEIVDWMQIGKYALQFLWSDTHDTGIYPFDFLKKICRCSSCVN